MILAYRTRERPLPWIKPILASAPVAAFVWFFRQLTGQTHLRRQHRGEPPRPCCSCGCRWRHAFDVPARRDLAFSLAGSASLMAVAAAQAIDLGFGVYVVVWLRRAGRARRHVELGQRGWTPASRRRARHLGSVVVTGTVVLAVLPAPTWRGAINFPLRHGARSTLARAGEDWPVTPRWPSWPNRAPRADATRVGGYLGFSNHLDTALRGALGDTVVMRVRPGSTVVLDPVEAFDSGTAPIGAATAHPAQPRKRLDESSPFILPAPRRARGRRATLQTFYVCSPRRTSSSMPTRPTKCGSRHDCSFRPDSIVSPDGLAQGAIYTVESYVNRPSVDQLRAVTAARRHPGVGSALTTKVPHP